MSDEKEEELKAIDFEEAMIRLAAPESQHNISDDKQRRNFLSENHLTISDQRPDCWVAWHPQSGATQVRFSKTSCEHELVGLTHPHFYPSDEEFCAAYKLALDKAMADGYRIRPVKLVFLDEEKIFSVDEYREKHSPKDTDEFKRKHFTDYFELREAFKAGLVAAHQHPFAEQWGEHEFQAWLKERKS